MNLRTRGIAVAPCITTSLSALTGMSPAIAHQTSQLNHISTSYTGDFTDSELKQIEKEVEILFTRYVVQGENGSFYVNQKNVYADGAQAHLQAFEQVASLFNSVPDAPASKASSSLPPQLSTLGKLSVSPQGPWEFTTCVLENAIGVNALAGAPGLINAAKVAVIAMDWGLAATAVARFVGPMVLKSLGGPWGLAVALAAAAIGCKDRL